MNFRSPLITKYSTIFPALLGLLFHHLADPLGDLAAPVLVQGRNGDFEDLAVVDRVEAVFRTADSLLQGFEDRGVPGLEDDQRRIGNAQGSDLVDRRERPVIGDLDALKDVDVRPSRPELAQFPAEVLRRDLHLLFDFFQNVLDHCDPSFRKLGPNTNRRCPGAAGRGSGDLRPDVLAHDRS